MLACDMHRQQHVRHRIILDLYGTGPSIPDFVMENNYDLQIISNAFASKLINSGLTGFSISSCITIAVNQSGVRDPRLFLLEIVGQGGDCYRFELQGGPNLCQFCNQAPIVCPECGQLNRRCTHCDKILVGEGVGLIRPMNFQASRIVEARDWDGSDVFVVSRGASSDGGGWFVNRRAKEWLRENLIKFECREALLNIEGVDTEKLKQLGVAAD